MLSDEKKNQLYDLCIRSTACPATVQGELQAFRQGIAAAVDVIAAHFQAEEVAEQAMPEPDMGNGGMEMSEEVGVGEG